MQAVYRKLFDAYGPQGWWPARTRLEVIVGAVLVQHTSWKNVETAIRKLRKAKALSIDALAALDEHRLAELLTPAGPPRVKARRLKSLVAFVQQEAGGSLRRLFAGVPDDDAALELRQRLLAVHGVGPETADAILLYAGEAPLFVVDDYARRVLGRHGLYDPKASYADVQRFFESRLERDTQLFNEYHALLVRVGVEHCKKPTPRCEGCPLRSMLPRGGPLPL